MFESVGGIAPLAGSLTLLIADGRVASAWRGAADPNDPVGTFQAARAAGGPAWSPVAIGSGSGYLVKLGGEQRDATVFRLGRDHVAVVGPYREGPDEDPAASSAARREIHEVLAGADGARLGTLEVRSGLLVIAHASGALTGEPGKAPEDLPPDVRAQVEETSSLAAARRTQLIGNLDEVKKHMAACPLEDRAEFYALIKQTLQFSADGAAAQLELFGGTSAMLRDDTGDSMLVVPPGTYHLTLSEVSFRGEPVGVLQLTSV